MKFQAVTTIALLAATTLAAPSYHPHVSFSENKTIHTYEPAPQTTTFDWADTSTWFSKETNDKIEQTSNFFKHMYGCIQGALDRKECLGWASDLIHPHNKEEPKKSKSGEWFADRQKEERERNAKEKEEKPAVLDKSPVVALNHE